jgi:phospholipid/cholesterol/gamma-HCH transport system substrate-binding protein
MIEANRRVSVWVGLLVAIVGVTAGAIVLFLGSATRVFGHNTRVTACFSDVTGLTPGAAVLAAGVRIGAVADVALGGSCGQRAQATLALDGSMVARLSDDTHAQLATVGLLGDRVVALRSGSASARLHAGSVIEGSVPTDANEVIAQAGHAFERLARIAGRLESVVADADIGGVLDDVATMSHTLRSLLERFDRQASIVGPAMHNVLRASRDARSMMAHLDRAAGDTEKIVAHVRAGQGTLGGVIYDPAVYEDLRTITGGVRRSFILRSLARYVLRHH